MSFVTKEWKDRLAEFAGRRKLTNVSTGEETTVDVSRAEGEVSQAGDAFSAANMNDLEQRIKDGFDKVDSDLGGFTPVIDSTGKITGYKTRVGADTVFPFSGVTYLLKNGEIVSDDLKNITITSGSYSLVEDNIGKYLLVNTDGATLCFKIDLTNYKKLILACRSDGKNNQFNVAVYSSLPNGSIGNIGNSGSCLDVSSYTGEYYVCTSYIGRIRVYDIIGF